MFKLNFLLILSTFYILSAVAEEVKLSLGGSDGDNSTFTATEDWQEIKPGQKVPQGLHYRINLQTGKTEAKLLDPTDADSQKTSLQATATENTENIEQSRQRLEEALKNIPTEKFEEMTEEKWKEVSKKFRTYEKLKEELKDINLTPKTETEVMQQLLKEFSTENHDVSRKLDILKDLEFLMHSIDNSLQFISSGHVEKLLIPNLINQTDPKIRIVLLKMFGAMLQNNQPAKKYVTDRTNLPHEILNLMSKTDHVEELSACLYATGSLFRNNKILSQEIHKEMSVVLLGILAKSSVGIAVKVKDLTLISDLIKDGNFDENFLKSQKFCEIIGSFFEQHKNSLIVDADAAEKCAAALLSIDFCRKHFWSEMPMFRHSLLVVISNYRMRLNEEMDEDVKFMFELIIEQLEGLNRELYGHLRISDDDLTEKYGRDEL